MAYHKRILRELVLQVSIATMIMPISFKASAAVQQMSEDAAQYDIFFGQILGMAAKYILSPFMVMLAAWISTKIKSAADEQIDDPKRTKFVIGIVASFGVWFLAGWLYNLPFEARMPLVLTSTVLAPPILVNVYGYISELKTLASLRRFIAFFSRFKAAWDAVGSMALDDNAKKPTKAIDPETTDKGQ